MLRVGINCRVRVVRLLDVAGNEVVSVEVTMDEVVGCVVEENDVVAGMVVGGMIEEKVTGGTTLFVGSVSLSENLCFAVVCISVGVGGSGPISDVKVDLTALGESLAA